MTDPEKKPEKPYESEPVSDALREFIETRSYPEEEHADDNWWDTEETRHDPDDDDE